MGAVLDSIRTGRQIRGKSSAMTKRIMAAALCLLPFASLPAAAQTGTQQAQELRYLDLTARNDGWVAAQTLAVSGSGNRRVVIVSYADPATTRAFYDLAVGFARPPQSLPIFGVIRAPQHPTEPNGNGFDIYINGLPLGEVENPDNAYTPAQHLQSLLNYIRRDFHPGGTP